jgi:vacuolar-type H+-ATPase subunit F/Vma7
VTTVQRVVAVGERDRVAGFALAGAEVVVAEDPPSVRAAVAALDDDVAVVLLTLRAATALGGVGHAPAVGDIAPGRPLPVVMPG